MFDHWKRPLAREGFVAEDAVEASGYRECSFFDVLPSVHFSIFILVINHIDTQNLFYNKFLSCLYMFRAHVLNIRRSKLYYTASGIITLIGGRPVHQSSLNLCTGRPPIGVMIPEAL